MPQQETFLSVKNPDETIEVLKTYDQHFAKEAFRKMDDSALALLASSLNFESIYDPSGIPKPNDEGYEDFIWDVMVDEAREDWNSFSYFIVTKSHGRQTEELFVSGDWPTAQAYVKTLGISDELTSKNPA